MHPVPSTSYVTREDSGRGRRGSLSAEGSALRQTGSHEASSAAGRPTRRRRLLRSFGRRLRTFRRRPFLAYRRTTRISEDVVATRESAANVTDPATAAVATQAISMDRPPTAPTTSEIEAAPEIDSPSTQPDVGPSDPRRRTDVALSMRHPAEPPSVAESTVNLHPLVSGAVFAERYTIDEEQPREKPHCRHATDLVTSQRVVLKFCINSTHEWMNAIRVHGFTQQNKYICKLLNIVEAADGLPLCLVLERGNYSLSDRLSARHPNAMEQRAILYSILEALEYLHGQDIYHGTLHPSNIMWFSSDFTWKLSDLEYASRSQELAVVPPDITPYSAPEMTLAHQQRKTHVQLSDAADMFAVGIIAFEMFTCSRVYDIVQLREYIETRLVYRCLGHEGASHRWLSADRRGRSAFSDEEQTLLFVQELLSIDPSTRQTANEALTNRIFRSVTDTYQRIDVVESLHPDGRLRLSDIFQWPEWTWPPILNEHTTVTLLVESFLRSSSPSTPFHLREAQEVLRFYDDYLPDNAIHVLRRRHDTRLRIRITPDEELAFPIEGIASVRVGLPDEDTVEMEVVQNLHGRTIEAMVLIQPSKFHSRRLHVTSPHFGLVDQKYVKLTVQIRIFLGAPFRREIDLYRLIYCKIIRSRNRLRFHRLVRMFENQKEHNIFA